MFKLSSCASRYSALMLSVGIFLTIVTGSVSAYAFISLDPRESSVKNDNVSVIQYDNTKENLKGDTTLIDESNFANQIVEVKYKQKGRFFALIPIRLNVSVKVGADGTVEVKYPWYSIFTIDNKDEMETKFRVAVDNVLRARTVGSVKAEGQAVNPTMTTIEATRVVDQIQEVIKSNLMGENSSTTSITSSIHQLITVDNSVEKLGR